MEEPVDPLFKLLSDVAAIQREQLRRADLLPVIRARLERSAVAAARAPRRRLGQRWLLPAGAIGLAALAAAAALWLRAPARLSFVVGESTRARAGRAGEILAAEPTGALPIQFSDGSHLALGPGARVEVRRVEARGATLAMERGELDVQVVHRAGTHWVVKAGPFDVTVTGTRFTLGWEPGAETLTVEMREGSVDVSGLAGGTGHQSVRAGERLRAGARTRTVDRGEVSDGAGAPVEAAVRAATVPPALTAPPVTPAPRDPPPARAAPTASPAPAPVTNASSSPAARGVRVAVLSAPDDSWRQLASEARYREALRAAERVGFEAACRRLGSNDLALLGDVARLAGDPQRAERAYLAAHARFPNFDRPVFALGLTAFEQRKDFGRAAQWFELYLHQYPSGPLEREAAGRALESWRRAGDGQRARRAAGDYLSRYPTGPHAALARQTADAP
jgi:transmembrane sensor